MLPSQRSKQLLGPTRHNLTPLSLPPNPSAPCKEERKWLLTLLCRFHLLFSPARAFIHLQRGWERKESSQQDGLSEPMGTTSQIHPTQPVPNQTTQTSQTDAVGTASQTHPQTPCPRPSCRRGTAAHVQHPPGMQRSDARLRFGFFGAGSTARWLEGGTIFPAERVPRSLARQQQVPKLEPTPAACFGGGRRGVGPSPSAETEKQRHLGDSGTPTASAKGALLTVAAGDSNPVTALWDIPEPHLGGTDPGMCSSRGHWGEQGWLSPPHTRCEDPRVLCAALHTRPTGSLAREQTLQ